MGTGMQGFAVGSPWTDGSAGGLSEALAALSGSAAGALDGPPTVPPGAAAVAAGLERQMQFVQREVDALRNELDLLRRRDEALNFYMLRLDEELRLAARLQQDFLPKQLPRLGPVHARALFRPAGYVSGDLYDVIRLDDRHLGFYMADAVGHGVPAAMLALFLRHALVTTEPTPTGPRLLTPAEAMARLNESLVAQNLSQASFATAVYGVMDAQTLRLTVARAGHPSPLVLRAGGELETVEADGPLLGIFPGATFAEQATTLAPGDRLFLYTDGVEVAFCDDCRDTRRWREELFRRRHLAADEMVADLVEHLDRESGSLAPKDDLTMIVADVRP